MKEFATVVLENPGSADSLAQRVPNTGAFQTPDREQFIMPSPKSGSADDPVPPGEPKIAEEADQADPGEIEKVKAEQRKSNQGKYASSKLEPLKAPQTKEEQEKKKSWIEIELVNKKNKPVPGEPYCLILADGKTATEGTLDEKGFARIEGIEPGQCKILFPRLDKNSWKRK